MPVVIFLTIFCLLKFCGTNGISVVLIDVIYIRAHSVAVALCMWYFVLHEVTEVLDCVVSAYTGGALINLHTYSWKPVVF